MQPPLRFVPRLTLACCLVGLFSLTACDSDDPTEDPLIYTGTFVALNNSGVSGTARFEIDDGIMAVTIDADGLAPSITHVQHVHFSNTCPTAAADANSDSFVDVAEGLPSYGAILIPLDGDLSAQAAGDTGFPSANAAGALNYSINVVFSDMVAELAETDPNPDDAVVKLEPGAELALQTRTVVLHGVDASTALPGTVASLPGVAATATLPVACAVLTQQ